MTRQRSRSSTSCDVRYSVRAAREITPVVRGRRRDASQQIRVGPCHSLRMCSRGVTGRQASDCSVQGPCAESRSVQTSEAITRDSARVVALRQGYWLMLTMARLRGQMRSRTSRETGRAPPRRHDVEPAIAVAGVGRGGAGPREAPVQDSDIVRRTRAVHDVVRLHQRAVRGARPGRDLGRDHRDQRQRVRPVLPEPGRPELPHLFATSETQCNQRGGDWYTADQGYEGFAAGLLRQVHRAGVLPVAKRSSAAHLPTRFRFHARGFTVSCTP
jgi:hypothetical protein